MAGRRPEPPDFVLTMDDVMLMTLLVADLNPERYGDKAKALIYRAKALRAEPDLHGRSCRVVPAHGVIDKHA